MDTVDNKEPLRILHVVTRMDAAGIETFIMNIYRNIDRDKVQFDFLTHRTDTGFYDDEIKSLGGRIYNVPSINPFHHKDYIKSLDEFFLEHHEYSIVHSHINAFSMYILRSAQKNKVKVRIAHSHTSNLEFNHKYVFNKYCMSKINLYTTSSLACSVDAGKWLFKENEFEIINNGIDISKYTYDLSKRSQIRNKLNLENKIVIGNIGRLVKTKNQLFLLDILKELVDKKKDVVLLIIGKGPMKKKLLKKAESLGLNDNLIILENRNDIDYLLQAMDIFIFPSFFEGLGIVAVEAQAAGLPVIISEKLPKELELSDNIRRLSLYESPTVWSSSVLELLEKERSKIISEKLHNQFDIQIIASDLQKRYIDSLE